MFIHQLLSIAAQSWHCLSQALDMTSRTVGWVTAIGMVISRFTK